MTIEEILTEAGVTDADVIAKVRDAMPKAFMPLADANKRIAAAKQSADEATKALDDLKSAQDAEGATKAGELEQLRTEFEALQQQYSTAQEEAKKGRARGELAKALKAAGANPAAVELMATSALGACEYGDDGNASNVADIVAKMQEDNAALFGKSTDTGAAVTKGDGKAEDADRFLKGFGTV